MRSGARRIGGDLVIALATVAATTACAPTRAARSRPQLPKLTSRASSSRRMLAARGEEVDAPEAPPIDTAAGAIAEKIRARYAPLATFDADFEEYDLGSAKLSGHVEVLRPSRMRWDYSTPAGDFVVSDLRTTWQYGAAKNEAQRFANRPTHWSIALSFVLGDCDLAKEYRLAERTKGVPKGMLAIEAWPKSSSGFAKLLTLFVDATSYEVQAVFVAAKGSSRSFRFRNPYLNSPIPASLFTWTPPPGVKLVP